MNQSDFFLLYLHIANQKAINNKVINPAFSADLFALLWQSNRRSTLNFWGKPGVVKAAKLKKPNLTKAFPSGKNQGPFFASFFAQGQKVRKAFTLLAFAGLKKTITVAEWKTPLGTKGVYNDSTFACFSESFAFGKLWQSNHSPKAKLLEKKYILGIKPNSHYVESNLNKTSLISTGKSAKASALVRFKKTLDSCGSKIFKPKVTFSTKLSSNLDFSVQEPSLHFSASNNQRPLASILLPAVASSYGGQTFFSRKAYGENKLGVVAKQLVSKKQTSKISGKKVTLSFDKAKAPLFNQRILGQSFKNNFVNHLKSCVSLTKHGEVLGTSREDHEIRLTSWAPIFDFNKPGSSLGSKSYKQSVTAAEPFASCNKASFSRILTAFCFSDRKSEVRFGFPVFPLRENQTSIGIKSVHLNEQTPCLALKKQGAACGPKAAAQREDEQELKKVPTNVNPLSRRLPLLLLDTQNLTSAVRLRAKRVSSIYDVSLVKDLFSSAKKENLLTTTVLTKFYTASWLLESIRAELSLRNANIKRVLNQTFLLTQQSFLDSSTLDRGSKPYFTLPVRKSVHLQTAAKGSKAAAKEAKINKPSGFMQNVDNATIIPHLIKGLRISFSGRLGGKKGMAKTLTKTAGRVPLSTLKEKVDFAKGVVNTKAGSLGVKVWICYN